MKKLSLFTKIWYGFGNIGNAIKTAVFGTFLFVFYNQVLGLSGTMCGLALMIALCFDAINDPLIGMWSDKFYSKRWGKRLPFMMFGALPFAIFLSCLFLPPSFLSDTALFIWLVVFAILTRTAQTFFQIPYLSLGAELSNGYVERSNLYSYGQLFGLIGNLATLGAGFLYFFKSTEEYSNGLLNQEMYPYFGYYIAILILIGTYGSILGTKSEILKKNKNIPLDKSNYIKDFKLIINNQSFRVIIIGILLLMIVNTTAEYLSTYVFIHFWELKTEELPKYLALPFALGLLVAVYLAPKMVKWFDKKNTLIYSNLIFWLVAFILIIIKLINIIPDNDLIIRGVLMIGVFIANCFAPIILITINSIFADISDEIEYETKLKKTGTLFSIRALLSKIASGVGSLFAGILIDLIDFPTKAEFGTVPDDIIMNLGLVAGPLLAILGLIPILLFNNYKLDKKRHEMIQLELEKR